MQEDLLSILKLWEAEDAVLRAQDGLNALDAAVSRAEAKLADVEASQLAAAQEAVARAAEEKTLQRRLDDTITRRERTRDLMDSGRATDFLTAQRQLDTMGAQASQLETEVMALMEAQELLEKKRSELVRAHVVAEARVREALADREAKRPGLAAELAVHQGEREARWTEIPVSDRSRYKNLRARNLRPIANIARGACEACHQQIAQQILLEVRRGAKTHTCWGCGRWLVDEAAVQEETA